MATNYIEILKTLDNYKSDTPSSFISLMIPKEQDLYV